MPVWEEDGVKYAQSSSILRMLGVRLGYYSEDPMTCWAIDSIVDFVEDLQPKYVGYLFPAITGGAVSEDASTWFADYWDKVIPVIEARIAGHGKTFIAGTDRPTIADFKAFQTVISGTSINPACVVPESVRAQLEQKFAASPNYQRWVDAMKGELASYLPNRPPRPF